MYQERRKELTEGVRQIRQEVRTLRSSEGWKYLNRKQRLFIITSLFIELKWKVTKKFDELLMERQIRRFFRGGLSVELSYKQIDEIRRDLVTQYIPFLQALEIRESVACSQAIAYLESLSFGEGHEILESLEIPDGFFNLEYLKYESEEKFISAVRKTGLPCKIVFQSLDINERSEGGVSGCLHAFLILNLDPLIIWEKKSRSEGFDVGINSIEEIFKDYSLSKITIGIKRLPSE